MSYAFTSEASVIWKMIVMLTLFRLATLRENPHQSYQQLLNSIRDILRDKYEQRPQMSSSHPIDVHLEFVC